MIQLSEQLKKLRKKQGLSQEELSGQLFISRQSVSKWEKGETVPDLEHLVALSRIFDVSLDYLILNKNEEKSQNSIETLIRLISENKEDLVAWLIILLFILVIVIMLLF